MAEWIFENFPAECQEAYRSQMLAAAAASDAQQGQVNAVEAQHDSLFISGWRPMIGWVCAMAAGLSICRHAPADLGPGPPLA
ncbi:MAG: hypothetical protein FD149_2157 [Rhodospirillaceae bacterium]|nr:MAG: hypothetical protein FD149_2157 [Rhodospirillaceae bacterium]